MTGKVRLVLLSFLMLFLELALIRWIGSNVVYLSYFSNFVLLGSFLGIGLGFLRAKSRENLFPWAIVVLAFLVGFVFIFPAVIDRSGTQLIYFGGGIRGLPIWVMLPGIFLAVAAVMAFVAQGVARAFSAFEPLEAYRLDILGSLAGIAGFSLLSFLGAPPVAWGALTALVFIVLHVPGVRMIQVAAAIAMIFMLGRESLYPGFSWSPYYKIFTYAIRPGLMGLDANGIPHQWIASMAWRRKLEPLYFVPYTRLRSNPLRDVLIVGAGGGSDVAIALAAGAKHVDAVEIDPRIYQLGRRFNPDRPYQDPHVSVHINDGRAFLQRTSSHYDLILFALPDSLTLVSGQSSLRLESYLFTLEAIRAARAHLNPSGAFGMYNYYREQWLVDRYAGTLQNVFGRPPCVDTVGRAGWFALLMVGLDRNGVACRTAWNPGSRVVPAPSSDDYPFPYLQARSIPPLYLVTLGLILLASLVLIRGAAGPLGEMRGYLDLFFMGAAFLLLETKNVVQFALLFGTTWFVNALVFFGILLAVLGAIEVARRVRFRDPTLLYAALFASLCLAWAIQPHTLLTLDFPLRFAAAVSLAFVPVFLANLVFAQRFREVASSTVAFATNLLGAMVGGVLEYSSLVFGYRNLLLVVALIYGLAFLLGRKSLAGAATRENAPTPAVRAGAP
jgi:hypothetical protein